MRRLRVHFPVLMAHIYACGHPYMHVGTHIHGLRDMDSDILMVTGGRLYYDILNLRRCM